MLASCCPGGHLPPHATPWLWACHEAEYQGHMKCSKEGAQLQGISSQAKNGNSVSCSGALHMKFLWKVVGVTRSCAPSSDVHTECLCQLSVPPLFYLADLMLSNDCRKGHCGLAAALGIYNITLRRCAGMWWAAWESTFASSGTTESNIIQKEDCQENILWQCHCFVSICECCYHVNEMHYAEIPTFAIQKNGSFSKNYQNYRVSLCSVVAAAATRFEDWIVKSFRWH